MTAVVAVGAGTLVALALSREGYQARHVDLNDGGVWVTSSPELGLWGRLNRPAGSLDLALSPPGRAQSSYELDIRQDGAAVAAWDVGGGSLYPVDPASGRRVAGQDVPVSAQEQVQLGGGTAAVLDPSSGRVWAQRVDVARGVTSLSALDPTAKPKVKLAPGAAVAGGSAGGLAVGTDGTVYAVMASGRTAVIHPKGRDGFAKAQTGRLGARLDSVQVSAVGSQLVVLDANRGRLYLPGKRTVSVTADPDAQLQAASDAGHDVVVATSRSLIGVPLSGDDRAHTMFSGGSGRPAVPTWLGPCVHAAWASPSVSVPGVYARACGGGAARQIVLPHRRALVHPVFRVNRGAILLNDLSLGNVFDLSSLQEVDDWSAVKPPPVVRVSKKNKNNTSALSARDLPPKANDDQVGARPGRTTVLHVLDNDSDPSGAVLAITRLTGSDDPKVNVQIAPDGQTVEASLPSAQARDVHFKYTIDDGKGLTATASVTVAVRPEDENGAPHPRSRFQQRSFSVSAGGRLEIPVLDDWRDPDGDPLVVTSAHVGSGSVTVTPDGRLNYVAPAVGGAQKLTYQVSDGRAAAQKRIVPVTVLAPDSAKTAAPVAQPDIARGEVGKPIRVKPLGNDLPGADPTNPNAQLALAGSVASPAGARVATDLKSGEVTITASRHGTFVLNYTAAYGNAHFGHSVIRVDVANAPATPQPPVAVPDTGVLYGQSAATIDVVANDFDPAGGVLVVQHAEAESPDQLQVAIVGGRFLRVNADQADLSPNPQVIRYTITDGLTAPVSGELTVTQQPSPDPDVPLAVDDYATVRAGDSSLIPVLDNDVDPAGATLGLLDDVKGTPGSGQLTVSSADDTTHPDLGSAFVSGKQVRYVAPTVARSTAATVTYVVQNPDGQRASGTVHVTVTPPPSKTNPDQAPTAQPVESRVISGDTIQIHLPTTNVDPDGDTANVTGITSAPTLGRIVSIGATSITYEAFPTESGTDRFGYTITDAYGLASSSTISVGVGGATDPQPPVAVDDTPTAPPGAKVRVDVLANDVIAPDDNAAVTSLRRSNPDLPAGTKLLHAGGPIEITAPAHDGEDRVLQYAVTDGAGDPSTATLTVHAQAGYVPPPVAVDVPATPAPRAATTTVDVLARASDPQGLPLTVAKVFTPGVQITGGKLVVPVLARMRNIVFEVANSAGAAAAAVVHVPARGVGAPYAKANTLIQVPRSGARTIDIADYVIDPPGHAVRLTTTDKISTAPADKLGVSSPDPTHLKLTGRGKYDGPAAVTFQVTDGKSLNDPKGQLALISVQVQVGDPTPVLRCPTAPIGVVEGGGARRLDVTALCHVWLPDRSKLSGLAYSARWAAQPAGVDILGSGGHTIGLQAHGSAKPGDTGTLTVSVPGTRAKSSTVNVVVRKLGPPAISPIAINGVKAGQTVTRDLRGYVTSPLADPRVTIVRAFRTGGPAASIATTGSALRITPGTGTHGVITVRVVVSDVAGRSRTDRQVSGTVTLHVLNVPDAPGAPQAGRTTLSQTVVLSWPTPQANGAQIDGYRVEWSGGSQSCPASPCRITGLHNGTRYAFRVRAHNAVGYSKPSAALSPPARPDKLPAAVTALATADPQDHSLHLSWRPVDNGSSTVTGYQVNWTGGGARTVSGGTSSIVATGLDNHVRYTFTVVAKNELGAGPPNTVQGQSAGNPGTPTGVTVQYASEAGTTARAVTVHWQPVDANGAGSPKYTVTRNGAPLCTTSATSCPDTPASAHTYTYRVQATNQAGHRSGVGSSSPFVVAGQPDTPSVGTPAHTARDGELDVPYTAPNSHGQQPRVECTSSAGSCGTWTPKAPGAADSHVIGGLGADANVSVQLRSCNEQQCGSWSAGQTGHTDGPPNAPSVSCSLSGDTITWRWTRPAEINGYAVHFALSGATSNGSTSATSYAHTYPEDGSDRTLTVKSVDSRGESGGSDSATCTDHAVPDPRKITISMGAPHTAPDCTAGCHYIVYHVENFAPNTNYTITITEKPGTYVRHYAFRTNGSGDYGPKQSTGYYGGPGGAGYGTVTGTLDGTSGSCYGNWKDGGGCT